MNNCKYCKDIDSNKPILSDHSLFSPNVYLDVSGDTLYLECESDDLIVCRNININYCPMCGRKLSID